MDEHLAELVRRVIREELAVLKPESPDVMTTEQAAERAGVSRKTVNEWIRTGGLRAGKRGRLRTVRREDLDRFLAGEPAADKAKSLLKSVA